MSHFDGFSESSSAPQFKRANSLVLSLLYRLALASSHATGRRLCAAFIVEVCLSRLYAVCCHEPEHENGVIWQFVTRCIHSILGPEKQGYPLISIFSPSLAVVLGHFIFFFEVSQLFSPHSVSSSSETDSSLLPLKMTSSAYLELFLLAI